MNQLIENQHYGRVEKGNVVEFPVTMEAIRARGHRIWQYSPVVYAKVPAHDPRSQKIEAMVAWDPVGVISVTYAVIELSLAELLAALKNENGSVKTLGELSVPLIEKIKDTISDYAESKVEALCISKGYKSLNNILGRYTNSSNVAFAAEASFIQTTLDTAWENLIAYYKDIEAGSVPLPTTLEEIDKITNIPATW